MYGNLRSVLPLSKLIVVGKVGLVSSILNIRDKLGNGNIGNGVILKGGLALAVNGGNRLIAFDRFNAVNRLVNYGSVRHQA